MLARFLCWLTGHRWEWWTREVSRKRDWHTGSNRRHYDQCARCGLKRHPSQLKPMTREEWIDVND